MYKKKLCSYLASYCGFFTSFQILRFMRCDRKVTARGESVAKPCISFVVRDFCVALSSKGIEVEPSSFFKRIEHLPINTVNPQWFLRAGSDLEYIPYTKSSLAVHGQQRKCCQVHKTIFSDNVLSALEEGMCTCT